MTKKKSYITATDQFCGAGGSSQGAKKAGVEVKMALNHWKLAIETHNTNFPDTDHDCTDVSACDPRRYPSTDILITSPECTTHSPAGGNTHKRLKQQMDIFNSGKVDPATERSRATMWDVCRFTEYHKYNIVIVENVVEAKTRWALFDVWLTAMHTLGYDHRCVYLNSMHAHPTPQSRDRMYVVFWKKGNKAPDLEYTPAAWCPKCEKDIQSIQSWKRPDVHYGKYRQQYVYRCPHDGAIVEPYYYAAFNCIDWSDPGTRIGDRLKPLSSKTVTRIQYGLDKYGNQPLQIINYTPGYTKPVYDPTGTLTATDSHGICNPPFMFLSSYGEKARGVTRPFTDPVYAQTSVNAVGLITPFIVKLEHGRSNNVQSVSGPASAQTSRQSSMLITKPLPTQSTTQGMGIVVPFVTISRGKSKTGKITEPLNCVSSGGVHSGMVTNEAWNSFLTSYGSNGHCTKHISEETGTVTAADRLSIVNYQKPNIDDCFYRMLKAPEIQRAMAFGNDYIVLGNSRQKVKQLGNAVTPPAMEWLVGQALKSLN